LQTLPRYRAVYLTKVEQNESDSGSDGCLSGAKKVHFAPDATRVTVHEWEEEGPEWAQSRRSDDVDWDNMSEMVSTVRYTAMVSCLISLPPVLALKTRQRARLRRESSKQGSSSSASSAPSRPQEDTPQDGTKNWTKEDLMAWDPEHIKAVTLHLFERHDAGKKGVLSWQDQEVLSFVQDFFRVHECSHLQLQSVVLSTAYNQVKVESLPSHRDVDGLDMMETCEFVRRVYMFVLNGTASEQEVDAATTLQQST